MDQRGIMPAIYTYRQLQDRILRRMGRRQTDTEGRSVVKDAINEVYTDVVMRKEIWQKLRTSEDLVFPAGVIEQTTQSLFRHIDLVFIIEAGQIRPLQKSTVGEFNHFVRDATNASTISSRKYFIVGGDLVQGSITFMNHKIRVYPPMSAEATVKIDGYIWPPDLTEDIHKPYLGPDLCLALIHGTVAYLLELDEDERADTYFQKYKDILDMGSAMENTDLNNWEPVTGALSSSYDDADPVVRYPWEKD